MKPSIIEISIESSGGRIAAQKIIELLEFNRGERLR
jgi:hypothetical protein